jgi:hypothetical protein
MADSIVRIAIEVEGADQRCRTLKVGDSASQSFGQMQKGAETGGAAVGKSLDNTGKALDQTTQKSGLTRREMSALGKVMASFGGGEIAHTAVAIGRVASALGALGAAAIGVGLAATALVKFGGEITRPGRRSIISPRLAVGRLSKFQGCRPPAKAKSPPSVWCERRRCTQKIRQAEGAADAIAASTKAVDDAQAYRGKGRGRAVSRGRLRAGHQERRSAAEA